MNLCADIYITYDNSTNSSFKSKVSQAWAH